MLRRETSRRRLAYRLSGGAWISDWRGACFAIARWRVHHIVVCEPFAGLKCPHRANSIVQRVVWSGNILKSFGYLKLAPSQALRGFHTTDLVS